MAATEPIRDKGQVRALAGYWLKRGNFRNYALIVLGVCTALRIGDLLRLTWADVYDEERGEFLAHITITEGKTGKNKTIALNAQAVKALRLYMNRVPAKSKDFAGEGRATKRVGFSPQCENEQAQSAMTRRGAFIFTSNRKDEKAISRVQAWRIIRVAVEAVKIAGRIACHSLRKTFGYFAWKAGVLPVMLMDIFNHSSFEITRRYLGISQDDRDKVYLNMAFFVFT